MSTKIQQKKTFDSKSKIKKFPTTTKKFKKYFTVFLFNVKFFYGDFRMEKAK
jgi:hypothetical protein